MTDNLQGKYEWAIYLHEEYVVKKRSIYAIAKDLGTYGNKIKRALEYYKIPLRSKSEAQTAALLSGRHPNPRKVFVEEGKKAGRFKKYGNQSAK